MNEIQKEVWNTVLIYTKLIKQGKIAEFLKYFHEDYTGWNNIEPLPVDKQAIEDEISKRRPSKVDKDSNIIPIKINVQDKLAIVHYYLSGRNIDDNTRELKRYTDVLIKKENKWLLIADHFGIYKGKNLFK